MLNASNCKYPFLLFPLVIFSRMTSWETKRFRSCIIHHHKQVIGAFVVSDRILTMSSCGFAQLFVNVSSNILVAAVTPRD